MKEIGSEATTPAPVPKRKVDSNRVSDDRVI
jgi:hypothetical protein